MKLLIIDNYDSFTYNLVHYIGELGTECVVFRNDAIAPHEIDQLNVSGIVISPGPCTPKEAGVSVETVRHCAGRLPLLGVCLGHQAIAAAFGAAIVPAKELMHGKTSPVYHNQSDLFLQIENPFIATRYHSLAVEPSTLPKFFERTAWSEDDEIMGIRHCEQPIWGVQFHPESFMTRQGKPLLQNFLSAASRHSMEAL